MQGEFKVLLLLAGVSGSFHQYYENFRHPLSFSLPYFFAMIWPLPHSLYHDYWDSPCLGFVIGEKRTGEIDILWMKQAIWLNVYFHRPRYSQGSPERACLFQRGIYLWVSLACAEWCMLQMPSFLQILSMTTANNGEWLRSPKAQSLWNEQKTGGSAREPKHTLKG